MTHDGPDHVTADGRDAREIVSQISRAPRRMAVSSAIVALGMISVLITVGEIVAGAAVILTTALLLCALGIHQAINFSPAVMARLERLAEQTGGRFTPWVPGTGDNTAVPFTEGQRTDRFGVVNYVERGMHLEIGHLLTDMNVRQLRGARKTNAYVAIQLPRRVPHMVIDFGHLSGVFRVRLLPTGWHRSQRVDVGGGRRFRLFVIDDGELFARALFSPDVVDAFLAVGRSYDVEIKGQRIYLFSLRSIASGSDRRLRRQQSLIDGLIQSMASPQASDVLRRQDRGRDFGRVELRTDVRRGVIIVGAGTVTLIAVVSVIVLYAQGLLEF